MEYWLCDPGIDSGDHSHPSIDQILMYVSGQVYFRLNGEPIIRPEDVFETAFGQSSKHGFHVRVGPGDVHGAATGPQGGAFLAFQNFLDGNPRSAELDWEGEPIDEEHAAVIRPPTVEVVSLSPDAGAIMRGAKFAEETAKKYPEAFA